MRRIALALLLAVLMLVPATSAGADAHCADLSGSAKFDYGRTGEGKAKLVYDGEKIKVDFIGTGFVSTGEFTADVFFDWFFPEGTVGIVEHSTVTPLVGPLVMFHSEIEVLDGAEGAWSWSGISNVAAGKAHIEAIAGTLCFGGGG